MKKTKISPPSVARDRPGRAWEGDAENLPDPASGSIPGQSGGIPGRRWVLTIPGFKPTFDNELVYVHWATARRRKRRDAEAVALAALAAGIPRATGRRRVSLTIRARFRRLPDDPAPLKSALDALVAAGLLVDDSREWMEFVWPPTYERGEPLTTITLEDI